MKERELLINDLYELVSIPTITYSSGIQEGFDCVKRIAERFKFDTKMVANGKVMEITPPNLTGVPKLGIVVHVDTVPYEDQEWEHNPLGEITDGVFYGRGVLDDKVGIITALHAVYELRNVIEPSWKIIVGSDEEGEWSDLEEYKKEGTNVIPEFVITIDGDGVQRGCRGSVDLKITFKRNSSVNLIQEFETIGGVENLVPDKVRTVVCGKEQFFDGISHHSSVPENGLNAIILAINILAPYFKVEFTELYMFVDELRLWNRNGFNFTPTIAKCRGDEIDINLNCRLATTVKSLSEVERSIETLKRKYDVKVEYGNVILPAGVSENHPQILLMKEAYEEVHKHPVNVPIALGTGYNAAFRNGAIFGPRASVEDEEERNNPDTCHCPDENMRIEHIFEFYDVLIRYLKKALPKK